MRTTYAVTWQDSSGESSSGKLELTPEGMVFEGSAGNGPVTMEIGYDEISTIRVARASADCLAGRPTLVLERRDDAPIRIGSVAQTGIISELAERLAKVLLEERSKSTRLALVLPLREGMGDRARSLIAEGPPFDIAASGLESHHVFVTDSEVMFLFEGETAAAIRLLAGQAHLWTVASGWNELLAGPPRVAEDAYSWARPKTPDGASFASTPGAGDSEGGDLFEP
jgi:hypothetical protein